MQLFFLILATILFGIIMEKVGEEQAVAFFIGYLFTSALFSSIMELFSLTLFQCIMKLMGV